MTLPTFASGLARQAFEESLLPIRPGHIRGQAFWNTFARQFIAAPSFEFQEIEHAGAYRYRVTGSDGIRHEFTADSPFASLAAVWAFLPEGKTTVAVQALGKDGKAIAEAGSREFLRLLPFSDDYPARKRSYAEASRLCYDYLFHMPAVQSMAAGEPDPEYTHFCYPSKMHAAIIRGMLRYSKLEPAHAQEAIRIACNCADYLIRTAMPAGHPLEYLPLTYLVPTTEDGKKLVAASKKDTIMMLYPAGVGNAMLELHNETENARYLEYAEKIGRQYLRLQRPDGTWALVLSKVDGAVVAPNNCEACDILPFLEQLAVATRNDAFRAAAVRGRDIIYQRIASFEWEGQFEDIQAQTVPYKNLSKHPAISSIFYLDKYAETPDNFLWLAREILRFSEDQFTVWQQDGRPNAPVVYEQYSCYDTVDASLVKMILFYLFMYDREHLPLDLAKARALGDSITRFQVPESGRIPTWCDKDRYVPGGDWLNCMFASANALQRLAAYDDRPTEN